MSGRPAEIMVKACLWGRLGAASHWRQIFFPGSPHVPQIRVHRFVPTYSMLMEILHVFVLHMKAQNMHVFIDFLHLVPPFPSHYMVTVKGLLLYS